MQCQKGLLIVISGPAGTGKGTVIGELMKLSDSLSYSVSATTRAPRPGEVDGVNYHFITKEVFDHAISDGSVLEYTHYCGNYYGTLKDELKKLDEGKNLILEIEVEGAMNVKRLCPESVAVFIIPPSYEILEGRLRGRGTNTEEDIRNRMKKSLTEIEASVNYDYIVVNENSDTVGAAKKIWNIIQSEQCRASRNTALAEEFIKNK